MHFELHNSDQKTSARLGSLHTEHGTIETPIFMPVGTAASVKAVHQQELREDIEAQIILGNTYHLYLRPGMEVMEKAGGIHRFMNWERPILTDSGGYQVYSLSGTRKIKEDGVEFQSHLDGSYHFFSPELAIQIQRTIGADIIMAFDECTPYPCPYAYASKSLELTHRWLVRCTEEMKNSKEKYGYKQALFPIVQGSTYTDLRLKSAEFAAPYGAVGIAIGGLSVGEPEAELYAMTKQVCEVLPTDKARYLMGVGTPWNVLECIALGVDMFDCVLPSRNARHGLLYTWNGTINIKNKKWSVDFSPLDEGSDVWVDQVYTKAYVRHLFKAQEYLALQIATIHNLAFYLSLMKEARNQLKNGTFEPWKNNLIPILSKRL
ncbi:MAG: tRNA guanosine(34) transglycosylase Tgt [Flavobacteriales bacterium]